MRSVCNISRQFCVLLLLMFFSKISIAGDSITPTQLIRVGDTIVSSKLSFELGFFSPGSSKNRYLGIWYKQVPIQTVVWVANRNFPITDSSSVLKFSEEGNLVLLNGNSTVVWSTSNQSSKAKVAITAQLLNSGNLVIREENDRDNDNFLWQSFDYPTDTLLPGMKLGWNFKTGMNRVLTSWKNSDDPAEGEYAHVIESHGQPQPYVTKRSIKTYRCGPWNGFQFSGVPAMKSNEIINFSFALSEEEIYFSFALRNESVASRLVVTQSGALHRLTWRINISQSWNLYWYAPRDQCDNYMECGDNGVCDVDSSPICTCIRGFEPKFPHNWYLRDGSGGCVQKTQYECQKDDGFLKMKNVKVPDGAPGSFMDSNMSLQDCAEICWRNCSCKAYANSNVLNGGSGCLIWTNALLDIRSFGEGGQDLYVRVAASELDKGGSTISKMVIVSVTVSLAVLLLGLSFYFIRKKKAINSLLRKKPGDRVNKAKTLHELPFAVSRAHKSDGNNDDLELPLFDLSSLEIATFNFSHVNKLGEGGFGSVYKGTFLDGKEIAVKRLSGNSGQGTEEFKNEVKLIARLQHRNLVRLLGCCVEGNEKMLVYEYMENRSLDSKLFDKAKSSSLGWRTRFNIIGGIARGLLYLHQDSRFRIIHRDLKASNVLLDGDMNPKISDFGMARIFCGDETEGKTRRVVGTYGYMSPEYAMDGLFSIKSDVFSFGVLVLEIISGKKSRGYYSSDQYNLLAYAWKLWTEGRGLELMDKTEGESCPTNESLRYMQVGMLCVQERAEDRPTMSSVVLMLSSETAIVPQPKQPGFIFADDILKQRNNSGETESQESCSVNQVTITSLDPR